MQRVPTLSSGRSGEPRHGIWPLAARDAVRICPTEDTVLRPVHGQLWVTFECAGRHRDVAARDLVLRPGERLDVPAGQTLVIGTCGRRDAGASFHWQLPVRVRHSWAPAWRQLLAGFVLRPSPLR
jgi:hypothetical protein